MPNRVCRRTEKSWWQAIVGRKKSANDNCDFHSLTSRSGSNGPETIAIRITELWKRYGKLEAVRESVLSRKGEIFGLIGPDGAGKTSTFQILAGVMEASAGSAEVFGQPAREARSQTGYLTQAFSLYPILQSSKTSAMLAICAASHPTTS